MEPWTPLPEIPGPPGTAACALCELSRQRDRVIWAEGSPAAPVVVVLDNPGAREDPTGAEFVCGTRQALRQAAREAGLPEDALMVTWVLKCRPRRAYAKEACRSACLPYLEGQLGRPGVQLAVVLGNVALQAFLGDPTAEVKTLRGQVRHRGALPYVCSYHPLAVRRRPNLHPYLVADLSLAATIIRKT